MASVTNRISIHVVRRIGAGAHITMAAPVMLSPRGHHFSKARSNVRIAIASAAFVGLAWMAGSGLALYL